MMNGPVATRNTCFALISAIEDDFRALCIALSDGADLLPDDVRANAKRRRQVDLRTNPEQEAVGDIDLLPYIDFADIAKVIESKIGPKQESHRTWLSLTSRKLLALTQARNRVCHTRPLEAEDLPQIVDFAESLLSTASPFSFSNVSQARSRLRDDVGFVLTLQIPTFWSEKSTKHHNLPIPEFDDTGFVGRQTDRLQVLRQLKSHYPVVTIVGEGGIGKTALALRCLYDLLDDSAFDAIIWVSLKTTALTAAGVRQLNGAITSTLGLLSEVARQLGVVAEARSEQEYIDEIAEYLGLYKILIAIDNLETVSVGPLRDLLLKVPSHSKVLLTSRVGLGEFEARYPLEGLEEKASISLARSLAKILGVSSLQKLDDGNLKGYCKKLFFNPLLIKWFVAGVGRGGDPNTLVSKEGESFAQAILFCFQNLYERLGDSEKTVVSCLACARRPLTSAELHFLVPQLSQHELEIALIALHNSSIVWRTKQGSDGFEYSLSDSTSAFVDKHAPPSAAVFKDVQARLKDLRVVLTEESKLGERYEYDPYFVRTGQGKDERICAAYLRHALDLLRQDPDAARRKCQEAMRLAPQSGEVWRIAALVEEGAKDFYKAYQHYETATDHDSRSTIALYCFGMFLMQDMEEFQDAEEKFNAALRLDPENPTLLTAKAMALNRRSKFEESARIHDDLLKTIVFRERRWRLTGVDQAADCYRRWAFRMWEQKEYTTAQTHFRRAITIIQESAERGDLDEKLLYRTAKVISDSLGRRDMTLEPSFCEFMLVSAERIHDASNGKSIPMVTHAHHALKNLETSSAMQRRLFALDRSHFEAQVISESFAEIESAPALNNDRRRRGTIHNLQPVYGFIVESDGSRWFFHRNHLRPTVSWEDLKPGSSVSFSLGKNEKGDCAVEVDF